MNTRCEVLPGGIVQIQDGKIHAVASSAEAQKLPEIETHGSIYPGLIDLHKHITYDLRGPGFPNKRFSNRTQFFNDPDYKSTVENPCRLLVQYGVRCQSLRKPPAPCLRPPTPVVPRSILIDTDPGVDDAVAILLALRSSEVKVEAVTVVNGNVETECGTRNALDVLSYAGRPDIPVALGARKPLMRTALTARPFHGSNGLGEVTLPRARAQLVERHAMDVIISEARARPHRMTIVAIGPLTNIAMALMKDASVAPLIAELAFMGGTILSNGNTTPVATFNIYSDPEAAKIVVNSDIPKITMVGTDVTTKVQFSSADFDRLDGSGNSLARLAAHLGRFRLSRLVRAVYTPEGKTPAVGFNDLPAMVSVVRPSLFTAERMKVDVETKGELTTGMTVANRQNRVMKIAPEGDHFGIAGNEPVQPNVDVCVGIDTQGVKQLFLERLA